MTQFADHWLAWNLIRLMRKPIAFTSTCTGYPETWSVIKLQKLFLRSVRWRSYLQGFNTQRTLIGSALPYVLANTLNRRHGSVSSFLSYQFVYGRILF